MDIDPVPADTNRPRDEHTCDTCGQKATHCYREGRGTGHSEHVCACITHTENPADALAATITRTATED
jgi:hypothetical protein